MFISFSELEKTTIRTARERLEHTPSKTMTTLRERFLATPTAILQTNSSQTDTHRVETPGVLHVFLGMLFLEYETLIESNL